ncbi:MAG: type II toxin-antitoxin system RelE/ParE family toxin [Patescibacteria group bacterium]
MKVSLSPRAKKQLKNISKVDQLALANKIRSLKEDKNINQIQKLASYKNIYRVRVGDYRIVFKKSKKEIYLILIGHRRDIYRLVNRLLR